VASPVGHREIFSFGLFEADPATGRLLKQDAHVRLQDQPFRMLMFLLERPGEVVTREELREKLWPENTFVEFDNGLNVAVKKIRDALGDDAENPRFVETLPRRGYRFIAPVAVKGSAAGSGDVRALEEFQRPAQAVAPEFPAAPTPRSRLWYYAAAGATVITIIAASLMANRIRSARSVAPVTPTAPQVEVAPRRSVAVMEFQNVSGRSENAWLTTAIPEMLSTELAAGEKLHLIPGEDVARVKRELHLENSSSLARSAAVSAGKNLKVDVLVVGSFTAMGSEPNRRVRVDLRLQDAANGEIVAEVAETGTEEHLFELISQAGTHVREHLGVPHISPAEEAGVRASVPKTAEAARLYAQGLGRLRVLDAVGARDLLEHAVDAEPNFPLSHMALASAWRQLGYDQKARMEAKKALSSSAALPRVDRFLIEGRYYEMSGEMDKSIAAYRARFALAPDSLEDGLLLAEAETWAGKRADAQVTLDALRRLPEPLSQDPRIDIQQARARGNDQDYLRLARRAEEKAKLQDAPLLQAKAAVMECNGLHTLGQPEDAIRVCETALRTFSEAGNSADKAQTLRFLGDIRQQQGRLKDALDLHGQALKIDRESGNDRGSAVSFNQMAIDYEAQGDAKRAEKLYRQSHALFLKVGNRGNAVVLASNVGGTLVSQGRLSDAEKWFEESLKLAQDLGARDAEGPANDGLAQIALLRGNLQTAREKLETSIARRRVTGNPFPLVLDLGALSDVLRAQGDLAAARRNAEEALGIAEKTGARGEGAYSRLALAYVDLEEGHPEQAEEQLRDSLAVFRSERMVDDELEALVVLSRSFLIRNNLAEAQAAIQQARPLSANSQNPANHLMFDIAEARVRTAQLPARALASSFRDVRSQLLNTIATAHSHGFAILEYEARLALGELDIKANPKIASNNLSLLEKDARARGFGLIVRKAAKLRVERPQ
jgi:DNA-binding winged helix-turn-helix (wHTH) protein/tetratricopeptide (TPR) repeat protein